MITSGSSHALDDQWISCPRKTKSINESFSNKRPVTAFIKQDIGDNRLALGVQDLNGQGSKGDSSGV